MPFEQPDQFLPGRGRAPAVTRGEVRMGKNDVMGVHQKELLGHGRNFGAGFG